MTIQFRCWYCHRRYSVPEQRIGQEITCSCQRRLRVPRKSGGACRIKTALDWVIEIVVYGGGGALLGFGLAVLVVSQVGRRMLFLDITWFLVLPTLIGFLVGALGGERGINWIGRLIRGREND
jgi:hypothetical protein